MPASFRLSGPVGANVRVNREDTVRTKQALQRLGFLTPPDEGLTAIADDAMIDGVVAFQKENGIAKDGAMRPGGPTEKLIRAVLFEQENGSDDQGAPAFQIGSSVGEGAANKPADLLMAKRALAIADEIAEEDVNTDMASRTFNGAIDAFQGAFNLKRDGKIMPGGETERALARVVRPELKKRGAGQSLLKSISGVPAERNAEVSSNTRPFGQAEKDASPSNRISSNDPTVSSPQAPSEKPVVKSGGPEIDQREAKFREFARKARLVGFVFPAEMLEYFLSRKGGVKHVPVARMRSFEAMQTAEKLNIKRFDDDWLEPKSLVYQKIMNLKDGETVVIKKRPRKDKDWSPGDPVWDEVLEPLTEGYVRNRAAKSNLELFYGSGNSTLHSEGVFRVTRHGNTVAIQGKVVHEWKDKYNWEKGLSVHIPTVGNISDEEGQSLEDHGRGKSFDMRSSWKQEVTGTIELRNGKPANPRIRWTKPE
jgi:hypothetical protein